MDTKSQGRELPPDLSEKLRAIASKLSHRIKPDEWRFSFYDFKDDAEIVACFMWEYLRENPAANSEVMPIPEFVNELVESYDDPVLGFRRDFNLLYKGLPRRIIIALLNYPDALPPWLSILSEERERISSTPVRPPLIPLELVSDEQYKWCYGVPKKDEVPGAAELYAYWDILMEKCKAESDQKEGAPNRRDRKTEDKDVDARVPKEYQDRDHMIAIARKEGILIQPDFLMNFIDYTAKNLKDAVCDWIDRHYPAGVQIGETRGVLKVNDILVALSRLAIMRLMSKYTESELRNLGLTQVDEKPNRVFKDERKNARQIYLKYFAFEEGQLPRSFITKASRARHAGAEE